jgi:hypothetical protein
VLTGLDRGKWRALVKVAMNVPILQNARKLPSGYATGDLSSRAQLHRISYLLLSTVSAKHPLHCCSANFNFIHCFKISLTVQ